MAEYEPLTQEQLIAGAAFLDRLDIEPETSRLHKRKPSMVVHALDRLFDAFGLSRKRAVLNAYIDAFRIAAGEKPPVFLFDGHEIELDLSKSPSAMRGDF